MNDRGSRHRSSGMRRKIFPFILLFILHPSSFILAQHTRLYACVIGSDAPGASMGGSSIGSGLWQSDDTAKSWKQIGWKHVKCYSVDVVNKSNGKIIYEACGNGVLRSTDAGSTWRMLTDWRITEVMDIAIDQKAPKNIYIATPEAIWKSVDGGESWSEADTDIPEPRFTSCIKISPIDHLRVYAATETGLYDSHDGGLTWKKIRGSSAWVRDIVFSSHGAATWVDDDGGFTQNGKTRFADSLGRLWSIAHYGEAYIVGGSKGLLRIDNENHVLSISEEPKNVHSLVMIDSLLFTGSLNGGIWKCEFNNKSANAGRMGLEFGQVWRLAAIEVK